MPEIKGNYIYVPIPKEVGKHKGHKIRTITISSEKGIKALYCLKCKKIITYMFDKNEWTMSQAKKWVKEHTQKSIDISPDLFNNLTTSKLLDIYRLIDDYEIEKYILNPPYLMDRVEDRYLTEVIDFTEQEIEIRGIIHKFLSASEREVIKKIIEIDSKTKKSLEKKYSLIKYFTRFKIVRKGFYEYVKNSFPIKFIKAINYGDVDYIASVNVNDLRTKFEKVLIKDVAQKTANNVAGKFRIKPINMSTNPYAKFYSERIRQFSDSVKQNVQTKIRAEVVESLKYGEDRRKLVNRIQKAFKEPILVKVAPLKDDAGNVIRKGYEYSMDNKRWANTVASTEVSYATNGARLDEYKASNVVKYVRWQTVSGNPCPDCASMNGREFTFNEAESLCPYHCGCYCTWSVGEYKRMDEPLPAASEFAEDFYVNPDGIGLMEMMKMPAPEMVKLNQLLDTGKIQAAKKMMARYHNKTLYKTVEASNIMKSGIIGGELAGKELDLAWKYIYHKSNLKPNALKGISSIRIRKGEYFTSLSGRTCGGTYQAGRINVVKNPRYFAHEAMHHISETTFSFKDTTTLMSGINRAGSSNVLNKYFGTRSPAEFFSISGEYMTSAIGQKMILKELGQEYFDILKPYFKDLLTPVVKPMIKPISHAMKGKLLSKDKLLTKSTLLKNEDVKGAVKALLKDSSITRDKFLSIAKTTNSSEFKTAFNYLGTQASLKETISSKISFARILCEGDKAARVTLSKELRSLRTLIKSAKEKHMLNQIYFSLVENKSFQKDVLLEKLFTETKLKSLGKASVKAYRGVVGDWATELKKNADSLDHVAYQPHILASHTENKDLAVQFLGYAEKDKRVLLRTFLSSDEIFSMDKFSNFLIKAPGEIVDEIVAFTVHSQKSLIISGG